MSTWPLGAVRVHRVVLLANRRICDMYGQGSCAILAQEPMRQVNRILISHVTHRPSHVEIMEVEVIPRAGLPQLAELVVAVITATPSQSAATGNMRVYQINDDCVVDLCQRSPEFATVGAPYPIEIVITARKECADVVCNQTLPCDSEFLRSDPPVILIKRRTTLGFPSYEVRRMSTDRAFGYAPLKEGCCFAAATVCACPQLCSYTKCVQPVLCIKKWGPECVCLYCPLCYTIEVCNSGSGTAYDVVVTTIFPMDLLTAAV